LRLTCFPVLVHTGNQVHHAAQLRALDHHVGAGNLKADWKLRPVNALGGQRPWRAAWPASIPPWWRRCGAACGRRSCRGYKLRGGGPCAGAPYDGAGGGRSRLLTVDVELPEPRALWWAALGMLEILKDPKDAAWTALAKPLLNRLDFHMRDLAAGAGAANDTLLRELLYAVAKSGSGAPLAKDIRSLYQLDTLFPTARGERVASYPVTVEGGEIWVDVP